MASRATAYFTRLGGQMCSGRVVMNRCPLKSRLLRLSSGPVTPRSKPRPHRGRLQERPRPHRGRPPAPASQRPATRAAPASTEAGYKSGPGLTEAGYKSGPGLTEAGDRSGRNSLWHPEVGDDRRDISHFAGVLLSHQDRGWSLTRSRFRGLSARRRSLFLPRGFARRRSGIAFACPRGGFAITYILGNGMPFLKRFAGPAKPSLRES